MKETRQIFISNTLIFNKFKKCVSIYESFYWCPFWLYNKNKKLREHVYEKREVSHTNLMYHDKKDTFWIIQGLDSPPSLAMLPEPTVIHAMTCMRTKENKYFRQTFSIVHLENESFPYRGNCDQMLHKLHSNYKR